MSKPELQKELKSPAVVERVRDPSEIRIGERRAWLRKLWSVEEIDRLGPEGHRSFATQRPAPGQRCVDIPNPILAKRIAPQIPRRFLWPDELERRTRQCRRGGIGVIYRPTDSTPSGQSLSAPGLQMEAVE